jgi:hypothetical protein
MRVSESCSFLFCDMETLSAPCPSASSLWPACLTNAERRVTLRESVHSEEQGRCRLDSANGLPALQRRAFKPRRSITVDSLIMGVHRLHKRENGRAKRKSARPTMDVARSIMMRRSALNGLIRAGSKYEPTSAPCPRVGPLPAADRRLQTRSYRQILYAWVNGSGPFGSATTSGKPSDRFAGDDDDFSAFRSKQK